MTSKIGYNKVFFKVLLIYFLHLKESQTYKHKEQFSMLWLVHCSNTHNSKDWARLKAEAKILTQISYVGGRASTT